MTSSGAHALVLDLHLVTVAFVGRISAAGGVAALAFTVIIVLMVLKPGV